MELGDLVTLPAQGVATYSFGSGDHRHREGDASTLDGHVSTDGAQIIVVGLRPGRSALLLEHRTGRVEILQLGVAP